MFTLMLQGTFVLVLIGLCIEAAEARPVQITCEHHDKMCRPQNPDHPDVHDEDPSHLDGLMAAMPSADPPPPPVPRFIYAGPQWQDTQPMGTPLVLLHRPAASAALWESGALTS